MKIDRLSGTSVTSRETSAGPTAMDDRQLRTVAAGIEPFSCASVDFDGPGGPTIVYHNGYPRDY